ncbi:MAG: flippase-like domain-containing protein [Candidatus Eisenbacteria bacterium]|nr:flippase-like domain-containing protein [Candidatus Eisenbacteria bacterium]MBU1949211.1 flippase-like domain-containing protein [Candidatus Eisenbacteria bacterium]
MPDEEKRPSRLGRFWGGPAGLVLRLAIGSVIFIILARQFWSEGFIDHFSHLQTPRALLYSSLYLLIFILNRGFMAYKWSILLHPLKIRLPIRRLISVYYASTFVGAFLPATVGGDLVRYFLLNLPKGDRPALAASILMERVVGLMALVTVGWFGLMAAWRQDLLPVAPALTTLAGGFILVLFAWISLVMPPDLLIRRLGPLGRKLSGFASEYQSYRNHPRALCLFYIFSMIESLHGVVGIWIVALALDLKIGFLPCLVAVPPMVLLSRVPISVDSLGVFQGLGVLFFGILGVAGGAAFALGAVRQLLDFIGLLPGGVLWLFLRTSKSSDGR